MSFCPNYDNTLEEKRQNDVLTKNEIISPSKPSFKPKRVVRLDFSLKHVQKAVISRA